MISSYSNSPCSYSLPNPFQRSPLRKQASVTGFLLYAAAVSLSFGSWHATLARADFEAADQDIYRAPATEELAPQEPREANERENFLADEPPAQPQAQEGNFSDLGNSELVEQQPLQTVD